MLYQDLEKIYALRDNFLLAYKEYKPYNYQKIISNKIIESVLLNKGLTITVEISRQAGKTSVVTDTVDFLIAFYFSICQKFNLPSTPFFNVGFFAPQLQQTKTDWDLIKNFLTKIQPEFGFSFTEFNADTIHITSNNMPPRMVYCFTASPTSNPESKTLNLIILEEAQALVDKQVDKAISPMGAHTHATEVYIGVGGYRRCKFSSLIEKSPPDQKIIIPYDMVIEEKQRMFELTNNPIHLNYAKHIEKKIKEIGDESDEFRTQYKLEWIFERGQFITYEQIMNLEEDYPIRVEPSVKIYGGIDWGKMHDSTIFTIINENGQILAWYEFLGDDYNSQIQDITTLISNLYRHMSLLHCDSTANQDMAVDVLKAELSKKGLSNLKVIGVNFSTHKSDMFKNLNRLMLDTKAEGKIIEKAKLKFPKANSREKDKFIQQFVDLQKQISAVGRWNCQAPEGKDYHDDYPCSIGLACMALKDVKKYRPFVF